ncbi:hypothetical protein SDC9_130713 [bioreactor metagenome]|uniref:Uncharacterized protein n=1 Tax=bioreactor metagenome TaxID=1076179 RepID=A0A645D2X4_9ZZZZ
MTTSAFNEFVTYRISNGKKTEIGSLTHGCIADSAYSLITQGTLDQTGRALDFAITGDGFFKVSDASGNEGLTRDGNFYVNADGYLTASSGAFVMGKQGRINIGSADGISVSEQGEIMSDGKYMDILDIISPEDITALQKRQDGTYSYAGNDAGFGGKVIQGSLELSNVNIISEMTSMIEASRAFQSCSQAVKIIDQMNQKTVNEIGRV